MNAIFARRGLVAAAAAALLAGAVLPAAARDFVQDQAGMFSSATVAQLNDRIGNFNAQTGKEIVVLTTPSLGGAALQDAAGTAFAQQKVNGVLIFIARDDRRDIVVPDRAGAQAGWFSPDVLRSIRTAMETQFRSENYDAGITGAVDALLNIYRAHLSSLRAQGANVAAPSAPMPAAGGLRISMFWWIIIGIVGFLVLRSILRVLAAPRYGAPPGAAPGAAPGAPGYGPGYGYGGYGGGGSFWSGLLGGLGGAWLGNELFRGGGVAPTQAGQLPPDAGGWGGGTDSGGWQSDAGQAGLGSASGGDWSGGGFGGDTGGGGDMGGGW
ncbi:MAG TPA: TPM domain-containing protein [Candidatus Babeliales bacterium]|nr:TPM domain-containing protein [Candidatus Babeliales bacterium]